MEKLGKLNMKLYISTILILIFAFSVFGQNDETSKEKKLIAWGVNPQCAEVDKLITKDDYVRCDSFVFDGETVMSILFNNIYVATSLSVVNGYIVADVYVGNNTNRRILVSPDESVIVYYNSEADYKASKDDIGIKDAIPPSAIAKKLVNRVRWANAITSASASMQNTTATVTSQNSQTGTTRSTVTVPNTQAQRQAEQQNTNRSKNAENQAGNIMASALKPNTVFEKDRISGLVYFKLNKKAKYAQMWLVIDDTYFIFDLNR